MAESFLCMIEDIETWTKITNIFKKNLLEAMFCVSIQISSRFIILRLNW